MHLPYRPGRGSAATPPRDVPSISLLLVLTTVALAIGLAHRLAGNEGWSAACLGVAAVTGGWAMRWILLRDWVG